MGHPDMKFEAKHFDAAAKINLAYEGSLFAAHNLDKSGVQAHFTKDGTLVVAGTNEWSDWWKFNFAVGRGATRPWHAGFLRYAQTVYTWVKAEGFDIKLITGHSLGAAAAQILGHSLPGVETICFASPKPLGPKTHATISRVLNICRTDDLVCRVPPHFGHVGGVEWIDPKHHFGEDHRIKHYIEAMKEANG